MKKYHNIALIVASGIASRFTSSIAKQYVEIGSATILQHTVNKFTLHPDIDAIIVVINKKHEELYKLLQNPKLLPHAIGGKTRHDSVLRGLETLAKYNPDNILIHDACRPLVTEQIISDVIKNLDNFDCVVPVLPITETIKKIENAAFSTVSRENMYISQTPQGIKFKNSLLYYSEHKDLTDDASIFEILGKKICTVSGSKQNIKITYKEDLEIVEKYFEEKMEIRTGIGFDAHKFCAHKEKSAQTISLGGIKAVCEYSILAHSDGDVLIHAIVDAILGAIGEKDIGVHFPPSDIKWKNADSKLFLLYAANLVREKNAEIINIDATVICEKPKISQYRDQMIDELAKTLKIEQSRINIKGTTTEKMGFTGREEGIAAQAIATIRIKSMKCAG